MAGRSAKATEEIAELVEGSVKEVESGGALLTETAKVLSEIVQASEKVAGLVTSMSEISEEQATAIKEISLGLSQVDDITQANTATAEQTSAAAEELASQALGLRSVLTRFTLSGAGAPAPLPPAESGGADLEKIGSASQGWPNAGRKKEKEYAQEENDSDFERL